MKLGWNEIEIIDKNSMIDDVVSLPTDIEKAIAGITQVDLPESYKNSDLALVAGMGGSGIPGDFLQALFGQQSKIPIFVQKNYGLLQFINSSSLVLAISYSGTTEETLDAFRLANEKQANIFGVTGGDKMLKLCEENNIPVYQPPTDRTTRASFAYLLFPIINVMQRLGFIPSQDEAIVETIEVCRQLAKECAPDVPEPENAAKKMALSLVGHTPIIYGSHLATAPAAVRWKQQFVENVKIFAANETFPDFTHNQILSLDNGRDPSVKYAPIFLRDQSEPVALQKRMDVVEELLTSTGNNVMSLSAVGESLLCRLMYLNLFSDFVSYYLAILKKVDPTPTPMMSLLKDNLGLKDLSPGQ